MLLLLYGSPKQANIECWKKRTRCKAKKEQRKRKKRRGAAGPTVARSLARQQARLQYSVAPSLFFLPTFFRHFILSWQLRVGRAHPLVLSYEQRRGCMRILYAGPPTYRRSREYCVLRTSGVHLTAYGNTLRILYDVLRTLGPTNHRHLPRGAPSCLWVPVCFSFALRMTLFFWSSAADFSLKIFPFLHRGCPVFIGVGILFTCLRSFLIDSMRSKGLEWGHKAKAKAVPCRN
jgi:hypothetical protein